ncbi:MAG: conserved membrane protein of unknown function [Promethearchaeota archaeon]|nr:MAG: conserved membrane protein of unknown function [Candidatus Lokiarchaeota archaeon]
MALGSIEIINGIFTLIMVAIYLYLGLRIASRYFELDQSIYLYIGLTWILIAEPWYPSTLSFIISWFNNGEGLINFPMVFLTIGNVLLPLPLIAWMMAFTKMLYKEKQKIVIILFVILAIIYEILFFSFLFIDYTLLGTMVSPVDSSYGLFMTVVQLLLLIILLITGLRFGYATTRSEKREHIIKGRFLLLAFISFVVGAVFDVFSNFSLLLLISARILLITSAIEFYIGFIYPEKIKIFFNK